MRVSKNQVEWQHKKLSCVHKEAHLDHQVCLSLLDAQERDEYMPAVQGQCNLKPIQQHDVLLKVLPRKSTRPYNELILRYELARQFQMDHDQLSPPVCHCSKYRPKQDTAPPNSNITQ